MTREIDRDGNMLVRVERFVTRNGNVAVKKLADFTKAKRDADSRSGRGQR